MFFKHDKKICFSRLVYLKDIRLIKKLYNFNLLFSYVTFTLIKIKYICTNDQSDITLNIVCVCVCVCVF